MNDITGGYINEELTFYVSPSEYLQLEELRKVIINERGDIIDKPEYNKLKEFIDYYMPLVTFHEKKNIILLNAQNYILIDNREPLKEFKIFILNDQFIIIEIDKLPNMIYNKDINVYSLNSTVIYSRIINYNESFNSFLLYINDLTFPYFNKLIYMVYDERFPRKSINPILSMIFINKFSELIKIIDTIKIELDKEFIDYYSLASSTNPSLLPKININTDSKYIIDYFIKYQGNIEKIEDIDMLSNLYFKLLNNLKSDNLKPIIDIAKIQFMKKNHGNVLIGQEYNNILKKLKETDLSIEIEDATKEYDEQEIRKLVITQYLDNNNINILKQTRTNIINDYSVKNRSYIDIAFDYDLDIAVELDDYSIRINYFINKSIFFDLNKENFNLIINIIKIVFNYITNNKSDDYINGYNYSLYIDEYRELSKNQKSKIPDMLKFIKFDRNRIKSKFILELSRVIYLSYKTNIESGNDNIQLAKKLLINYFLDINKNPILDLPYNPRQTIIQLLDKKDDNKSHIPGEEILDISINKIDKLFYSCLPKDKIYILPETRINYNYNKSDIHLYYVDCGERTLLNLFNLLLIKDDNTFDVDKIKNYDEKLKKFYETYPDINKIQTANLQDVKNLWGIVINDRQELIDNKMYLNKTYNFIPPINNVIFLCNILLKKHNTDIKEIIQYINPNILVEKIKITESNSSYIIDIYNIRFTFEDTHAKTNIISSFETIYNELEEETKEKILDNFEYKQDIMLIYKLGIEIFDEDKFKDYDIMVYLSKYFFNSYDGYNQQTFYYYLTRTINNYSNEDLEEDKLETIVKIIFKNYRNYEIWDLLYNITNHNIVPFNLLKRIYNYKIDDIQLFKYKQYSILDETKSYSIIKLNNEIKKFSNELKKIIKKISTNREENNLLKQRKEKLDYKNEYEIYEEDYKDLEDEDEDEDEPEEEPVNTDLIGGYIKNSIFSIALIAKDNNIITIEEYNRIYALGSNFTRIRKIKTGLIKFFNDIADNYYFRLEPFEGGGYNNKSIKYKSKLLYIHSSFLSKKYKN